MSTPDFGTVATYLDATGTTWASDEIEAALAAEAANQAKVCTVPTGDDEESDWPADLVEALCRRVAHNLALRRLPLGVAVSLSETSVTTDRVGGYDSEVRRLELPYRKRPLA